MTDLRQTKEFAQYLKSTGWLVENVDRHYIYIRRIPLTSFSIIKVQRLSSPIPFKEIDQLAKKYRALAVYLEPLSINHKSSIINHRYRLARSPFLPTKTIQLDLTQSEKEIFNQMKKDARYGIRKAEKEALQLIKVQDLARFHQAWKKSVGWNRWVPSLRSLKALKKAFGKKAIFLVAINQAKHTSEVFSKTKPSFTSEVEPKQKPISFEVEEKPQDLLAGTVILIAGKTAYYYYAFTSKEGRGKSAQYLLVWEVIKEAKKRECKIFDFEGIFDERFPVKAWKGFSHFKKSFGGKEAEFIGCLSRWNIGTVFRRKSE